MKIKDIAGWALTFSLILSIGCKKLVDVAPPSTSLVNTSVFTSNSTAEAAVAGLYESMMEVEGTFSGYESMTTILGLTADEFANYPNSALVLTQAYTNSLNGSSSLTFWNDLYHDIYVANAIIAGLNSSSGVTSAVKQQLMGQALFMRAFMNFYLVNIYGDVPLVLSTDYHSNASIARTSKAQVYQQIISDLKAAQNFLSANFVDLTGATTAERTIPNKGAAIALLARVYLYSGDYGNAITEATALINNTAQYNLEPNLDNIFLANSNEAVWQLRPVNPSFDTFDGYAYIFSRFGPNAGTNPIYLNSPLLNAFEKSDLRHASWVDSVSKNGVEYHYAYKYKVKFTSGSVYPEYLMVFRLAEQYLIRAEANAQPGAGNLSAAIADLNAIRNRAGLPNTTATTQPDVLIAIYHERQIELFAEWGHRWMDLKRSGQINSVMSVVTSQKGGTWDSNAALYPIQNSELEADPKLVQNPGY